jgi:hypothetical protein
MTILYLYVLTKLRAIYVNHVLGPPLLRRACVLQEHFLSRRFLYFGSQQLLWDCRQMFASEAYSQGLPPGMSLPALSKTFECYLTVGPDVKRPEKVHYLLCDLVQHYSRCVLTLEKDKFVAISGIVKEMLKWQNDTYLAGLWWYQLPSQLLWKAERPEKLSESPQNLYRAPS